ncbi:hypothetical protein PR202_ga13030 [Eleusine coracana subsp. coracana]|uniref:Uncharacterized protein n=1 Tax=Eleusine coracana subsp. coracana TaxID=191504 RepID=A0AAV5CDP1_ELECO|nr:hypothetical protein PR202_ga13030 [Eleusine coracana subsp. coracana]
MASVPLSVSSSQAGLLLLPLSLLQPAAAAGACLRYRLPRLAPPGLSSVRKGRLLSLPTPPRAAEEKNGWAVTKEEDVEEEEARKESEEDRGGDGAGGAGRADSLRTTSSLGHQGSSLA